MGATPTKACHLNGISGAVIPTRSKLFILSKGTLFQPNQFLIKFHASLGLILPTAVKIFWQKNRFLPAPSYENIAGKSAAELPEHGYQISLSKRSKIDWSGIIILFSCVFNLPSKFVPQVFDLIFFRYKTRINKNLWKIISCIQEYWHWHNFSLNFAIILFLFSFIRNEWRKDLFPFQLFGLESWIKASPMDLNRTCLNNRAQCKDLVRTKINSEKVKPFLSMQI